MITFDAPEAATELMGEISLARADPFKVWSRSMVHDGGGVERRSVVELDPGAKRDRHGELVLGDRRERGGQLRDDLSLRVQVVQLLAERQEHFAARERPCERRVESVGFAGGQTDDERAAVLDRGVVDADGSRGGGRSEQGDRHAREYGCPKADAAHRIRPSVVGSQPENRKLESIVWIHFLVKWIQIR
jgi:hypothetical protein